MQHLIYFLPTPAIPLHAQLSQPNNLNTLYMKKGIFFLFLLALLGITNISFAQKTTGCGFKVPPRSLRTSFASVYEAKSIIAGIADSIKWGENFSVREQNGIRNAYATIINKVRWIVYDNVFLEDIDAYAATKWASISVLAHEVGHHYYNHVVSSTGSTVPKELEADFFTGYTLYKLGSTLQEATAAMQAIGTDRQTSTHPAKKDRVNAITRGWNQAKGEAAVQPTTPSTPKPTTPTTPTNPQPTYPKPTTPPTNTGGNTGTNTNPQTDASWILLSVVSNKNETLQLSDDGKKYESLVIEAGKPQFIKFEIYNYGYLKLPYYNGFRVFKLQHGTDYTVMFNRRTQNWTVVEVPQ